MRCVIVVSLCVVTGIKSALLNKEEGEKCKLEDGEDWICQSPNNCPQLGDIRKNRPDICSFKDKVPIICCPPDKSVKQETTLNIEDVAFTNETSGGLPQTSNIDAKPPSSPSGPVPGSPPIALMKCIEYEVTICRNMLGQDGKNKTRLIRDTSGNLNNNEHVIGGKPAVVNQFPFIAVIGYGENTSIKWECEGTLISESWVLSAAHCASSRAGEAKWIGLGSETIYPEFPGLKIPIKQILIHPLYKSPAMYHDIALYQLKTGVGFNFFVRPMCLYALKVLPRYAVATGWNFNSFDEESSDLFHFDMVNANSEICEQVYNKSTSPQLPRGYDKDIMFCAGEASRKSCSGDHGGPIFYNSSICLHVQLGISSFGHNCGVHPKVYTRISYYLPWIENIIWPNAKPESFFSLK